MTCYAILEESVLKVGNTLLERQYDLSEGEPRHKALINKQTGYRWEGSQPVVMQVCGFSGKGLTPRLSTLISDSNGCSLPHLEAMLEYDNGLLEVRLVLTVYEDSPFISSQIFIRKKEGVESYSFDPTQADVVEVVGLYEPHMRLDRVTFVDKSDYNDTLVTRDHEILYARMHTDREGQMFLLSPVLHEEKLLLVKEAPCKAGCFNRIRPEFGCAPKKQAALYGSGVTAHDLSSAYFVPCYGATVGVGFNTDLFRAYRAHYGKVYAGDIRRNLFTMSNTWGDRSADKALCEAFMIKEGQCALEMGVELIQLDDGWQTGLSSGSAFKKGVKVWNSGFYREYEDFWKIHEKKFPNGFDPFRSDAYDLGIWFSLDGDNDYAQWEIDAEKMLELHKQYNVTHFKIDGITLLNKRAEWRFLQFFQRLIKESHGKVSFNMDITNGVRLGYLYEKQLGTLFVENRYTDTGAYYPHATLRNLWMLSTYIPTRKMQFEVLNPRRNRKLYGNDPIAPVKYDADYLFASV
ncbi:MAG TPA: hypothetical protein DCY74_02620, partial [Clostridiales bacterium]|nr:hypothetical protein [Clostridiales bacterium]